MSFLCFPGGTAVGTGLNTRIGFAEKVAENLAKYTGMRTDKCQIDSYLWQKYKIYFIQIPVM